MTETEVHEAMIGWINSKTGLTTIKAHQSGQRPAKPYIMANMTRVTELRDHECAVDFEENDDDGIDASVYLESEWMISLHCYGDSPSDPLRKLRSLYRIPDAQLSISPLIVHDIGPINLIPEFVKNEWEERAHCNLFVRGVVSENSPTDAIETAPVTFTTTP